MYLRATVLRPSGPQLLTPPELGVISSATRLHTALFVKTGPGRSTRLRYLVCRRSHFPLYHQRHSNHPTVRSLGTHIQLFLESLSMWIVDSGVLLSFHRETGHICEDLHVQNIDGGAANQLLDLSRFFPGLCVRGRPSRTNTTLPYYVYCTFHLTQ